MIGEAIAVASALEVFITIGRIVKLTKRILNYKRIHRNGIRKPSRLLGQERIMLYNAVLLV